MNFNTETVKDAKSDRESQFVSSDSIKVNSKKSNDNNIHEDQKYKKGFWSRLFGN